MNLLTRQCVVEFIGTFSLTFIGAGAIIAWGGGGDTPPNIVAIAFAHGLALSMAVYASGHISGGHINPAVTIGMLVTGKIKPPAAAAYIVVQLLGATLAAFILNSCLQGTEAFGEAVKTVKLGATLGALSTSENVATVIIIEAILTFLLVTTIFAVAVDKRGPKNIYGFAIGLTVCFDILCAGAYTGASMNPARSFGPALIGGHWDIHHCYWIGPIVGGVLAALVYDRVVIGKDAAGGDDAGGGEES
jgi:MIP family channel proteins